MINIKSPLISIVIPVFNSKTTIDDAINSIIAQTYHNWELLIVDDFSTDGTRALLRKYPAIDARIRLFDLPANSGPSIARNLGIKNARGSYLAFLDSDDLWLPQKLELQIQHMLRYKLSISHHAYRHMSHDGVFFSKIIYGPKIIDWASFHKFRGVGYCLTFMLTRDLFIKLKFPEDPSITIAEDFIAFSTLFKTHKSKLLLKDLGRYRVSGISRSSNKFKAGFFMWKIYRKYSRLSLITCCWYWMHYLISSMLIIWRGRFRKSI